MASTHSIVWTPRFIVIFALTLTIGLSVESLFTQGWIDRFYASGWVSLGHIGVILGCWVVVTSKAHSWWVRVGSIFGCIWAVFSSINIIVNWQSIDPSSSILAYLNASSSIALLGCYICLSIDYTPVQRWDTWFFFGAPIMSSIIVIATYVFTPTPDRTPNLIESNLAATAQVLSVLVWWIRPSCWQTHPGPTFLFGVAPALLLLLSIPNLIMTEANFFLTQVTFLCLILGAMRIAQKSKVDSSTICCTLKKRGML